ncbi:MAG: glycosyltransferase family 2 protein [Acidobacteriota bacterium]|nr:glycosyltransferase family 2 protein [Acidobacteriota bacterium]
MSERLPKCELSVVLPCYNEQEVVALCHQELTAVLSPAVSSYELIFVNDGSTDDTAAALQTLFDADKHVKVIHLSRNFGHQRAVSAGLEYASGRCVAIMDVDLQDPPAVLLPMLERWREGYEVIYGVRSSRQGESWFKLATAQCFYRLMNCLSETQIPQDAGDFRLLDRRAVDAMLRMREQHRLLRAMSSWIGFRQVGVPYERASRRADVTKYSLGKMMALAVDGVLSFSVVPLRMVSFTGLVLTVAGMAGAIGAIGARLWSGQWLPGWAWLGIAMAFLVGIQLLGLGVVGEYVGRVYNEIKQRPLYIVCEVQSHEEVRATAFPAALRTHA